ncbi:hypothetical protein [Kordiimonas sp.]|uniref:hypothetical protein n=1 Tax=Kordiimonas sp. TaxID=1970157 RepID=UPI003A92DAE0
MKDRFRDWNLYHKSVVAALAAFAVSVIFRLIIVIDAGFEISEEAVLPYSAEAIWPWATSDENRERWQAELIDLQRLKGEATETDATRLVFWRKRGKRWHAMEQTSEVLPGRVFATIQESDNDQRWFRIELKPEGECSTRVLITEVIRPKAYNARFWFFREKDDHAEKWETSLEALDRWLEKRAPACVADAPQG